MEFFQPKVATVFVEEVVGFALKTGFSSGSGWVIRESQMSFNCSAIPTHGGKLSNAGREGGGCGEQLAMTHLFLSKYLGKPCLYARRQLRAGDTARMETVRSLPHITSN